MIESTPARMAAWNGTSSTRFSCSMLEEMAARFMALQAKVISEIERALLNRTAAIEQLRQIEELVQVQQQRVANLEASFKAGAADQFELASARVEFAAVELSRLDAFARQQQAMGLLEDALQQPFNGLSTVEIDPKTQAIANE